MASQIRHIDPKTGIVYIYESHSYWDKEAHMSRSHRKLIGKIDPNTGNIVPTGKRGRPRKNPIPDEPSNQAGDFCESKTGSASKPQNNDQLVAELMETNRKLSFQLKVTREALRDLEDQMKRCVSRIEDACKDT